MQDGRRLSVVTQCAPALRRRRTAILSTDLRADALQRCRRLASDLLPIRVTSKPRGWPDRCRTAVPVLGGALEYHAIVLTTVTCSPIGLGLGQL